MEHPMRGRCDGLGGALDSKSDVRVWFSALSLTSLTMGKFLTAASAPGPTVPQQNNECECVLQIIKQYATVKHSLKQQVDNSTTVLFKSHTILISPYTGYSHLFQHEDFCVFLKKPESVPPKQLPSNDSRVFWFIFGDLGEEGKPRDLICVFMYL